MLNDLSSPAALLATRRSAKARDMTEPGPAPEQLHRILAAAARVPDHGKLTPWRFLVIEAADRPAFAALLDAAYRAGKADAGRLELEAVEQFAHQAPALVVVVSSPHVASHIPVWEQELSVGASCMALLCATHAEGFVGCWLTGWAAYSPDVADGLGLLPHERIAGFMFIGTAGRPVEERPRPETAAVVHFWTGRPGSPAGTAA